MGADQCEESKLFMAVTEEEFTKQKAEADKSGAAKAEPAATPAAK